MKKKSLVIRNLCSRSLSSLLRYRA